MRFKTIWSPSFGLLISHSVDLKREPGPIYYCLELFNEIKYEAMPGYPHIPTDGSYKDVILLDGGLTSNEFFSTAVRTFLYLPVDEFSDYSSNIRVP